MIDAWRHRLGGAFARIVRYVRSTDADPPDVISIQDGRGVSYALGFLLVFAVVIAGTLALFAVGVETLSTADRDESLASNQETFAVIHSEVGDMTAQGAPRRTLDIELVDASLGFSAAANRTLTIESDSGAFEPLEYETRVLQYHLQDRDATMYFAFGHGYRVSEPSTSSGISERPPLFDTTGSTTQLVVPVLAGPAAAGPDGIGVSDVGERRVEALSSNSTSLTRTHTRNESIVPMSGTLTIGGVTHPDVWKDTLERRGFADVQTRRIDGRMTVTGSFTSTTLAISTSTITFQFGGAS